MRFAQYVSLLLLLLVTGVFFGTWFGLSRSMDTLSAQTFVENGHAFIANLGTPMAVLFPLALLSLLPVLYLLYRRRLWLAFSLTLAGLILYVTALLITLLVNVPIDKEIATWTPETVPADWTQTRDHWEAFHMLRTFASLAGYACVLAAALLTRNTQPLKVTVPFSLS